MTLKSVRYYLREFIYSLKRIYNRYIIGEKVSWPVNSSLYDWGGVLSEIAKYNQCKTVVEIGVQYGMITEPLCKAIKKYGGMVYGYDIFDTHGLRGQFSKFADKEDVENRLHSHGLSNFKLTKVDTFSPTFPKIIATDTQGSIDLAFIDADHSTKGNYNDFVAVYPLLSKTGIIAFHDTFETDGGREFMIDLRTKYFDGTFDVFDLPFGAGERRNGMSFLVKRSFSTLGIGIRKVCNLQDNRKEILKKEHEWYKKELQSYKANKI